MQGRLPHLVDKCFQVAASFFWRLTPMQPPDLLGTWYWIWRPTLWNNIAFEPESFQTRYLMHTFQNSIKGKHRQRESSKWRNDTWDLVNVESQILFALHWRDAKNEQTRRLLSQNVERSYRKEGLHSWYPRLSAVLSREEHRLSDSIKGNVNRKFCRNEQTDKTDATCSQAGTVHEPWWTSKVSEIVWTRFRSLHLRVRSQHTERQRASDSLSVEEIETQKTSTERIGEQEEFPYETS